MLIRPELKQAFYASGCILNMTTLGMMYGFPAVLTPALLDPNSDIIADAATTSWIASLPGLSGLIPLLAMAPIMHIYGRRVAHIFITISALLGWLLTYSSYSLTILIISRFLQGFTNGGIFFFAICTAELSSPKVRCILLALKNLGVSLGIGIIHLGGYFLHWRSLALFGVVTSLLALVITLCWPQTPEWLASKGKFDEAEKVFLSLRGKDEESLKEITKLIETERLKRDFRLKKNKRQWKSYFSKSLWRPVALIACAAIFPELAGRHYIPSYSIELLAQISGDKTKGFYYTFIVNILSIAGFAVSVYTVKKYPRRKLLLYPGYSAVVIILAFSAMVYIRLNYVDREILTWASIGFLGFYTFLLFSSTYAVCFTIYGELLPLEFREIGTVLDGVIMSLGLLFILRIMPVLKNTLGIHGMFIVFSIGMLLTLLYLNYDLPETKQRTLQDIGDYFRGKCPKVREEKLHDCEDNDKINTA